MAVEARSSQYCATKLCQHSLSLADICKACRGPWSIELWTDLICRQPWNWFGCMQDWASSWINWSFQNLPIVPLKLVISAQCLIKTTALHELHTKQQPGPRNAVPQKVNCVHRLALLKYRDLVEKSGLCRGMTSINNLYCCWFLAYYSLIHDSEASLPKFNWATVDANQFHASQGNVPVCWQAVKWWRVGGGHCDVIDVYCVSNACFTWTTYCLWQCSMMSSPVLPRPNKPFFHACS